MCDAKLPSQLESRLEKSAEENQPKVGSSWASNQIIELLEKGAPGYHIYALNKTQSTLEILESLGVENK